MYHLEKVSIFALLLLIAINVNCQKSKDVASKIQIIKNTEKSLKPSLKIKLNEVMSLHEDWFDYGSIFSDRKGNIIYWQERDNIVSIFDNNGNLLLKKNFMKGQGYGDIDLFDFEEYTGKYYVFDKGPNRRISIFDKEFNIKEIYSLKENYGMAKYQIRIDKGGNIYFIFENWIPLGVMIDVEVGVANYGKDGKKKAIEFLKKRSALYSNESKEKMISYYFLQPFFRYLTSDDGKVWVCDMREYKIYVYYPDGKPDKIIEKEYKKIGLKGEIESKFREEYKIKKSELPIIYILPEYIYPLINMLLIDNDYFIIFKGDYGYREDKKGKIITDVFSTEGEFLNQTEFPEYYGCYRLDNQFKSNILYNKGYIYTLEADKEFEKFWIKKYELQIHK